jgi:DNA polymerase III subunit delta'
MQFKDVIGQEAVKQQLVELVQQNRLSHALLFLGREGNGSLALAIALAQYISCKPAITDTTDLFAGPSLFGDEPAIKTEPEPELKQTDSCGVCPSCSKANKLIHPDIHFTYPVIPKKSGDKPKSTDFIAEWRDFIEQTPYGNVFDWLQFIGAENKQGNITAEECNDIIRKLNLKSFESGYKTLIIWMPEYLGKEGNKLLKLIEEPPLNTLFILVAESEAQILPTILSRCQLVKIPALEDQEIEKSLVADKNGDPELARQAAALSYGNYREALHLLQHADENWQQLLGDWISTFYRPNLIAQVKWVEEISRLGREKQKQFLKYFTHMIEQAIRVRTFTDANMESSLVMADADKSFAIRLNKISGYEQQNAIVEELDKASYYIERNANAKILFQALTIKLGHIIHNNIVFLTH